MDISTLITMTAVFIGGTVLLWAIALMLDAIRDQVLSELDKDGER